MSFNIDFSNIYNFLMSNILTKSSICFLLFIISDIIIYKIFLFILSVFGIVNKKSYKNDCEYEEFEVIVFFLLTVIYGILTILLYSKS